MQVALMMLYNVRVSEALKGKSAKSIALKGKSAGGILGETSSGQIQTV